jgi:formylmethanofuran dehydrogenase subunit A
MSLIIKNGIVYDPFSKIDGEKKDIFIENGKIAAKEPKGAKVVDVPGLLVMPGGVDIHTHIAGGKINAGRILRPEDGRIGIEQKTKMTRVCSGRSVPNTFATGYRYAKMGYTTAIEPAMPPLLARHTHEELIDIPILDKGAIPLLDNNWLTMEYTKKNEIDKLARFIAWMISATRGYGVKSVNPGGVEAWGFGKNVRDINQPVPNFGVTPKEMIHALADANERLNLPHSIHVHCNNLGHPGNYQTTLETFEVVKDVKSKTRQTMHATHMQFHSYGGTSWKDMRSEADKIADYVNRHDHITVDMGQVMFGDTTTMTADGPMEYELHTLSRRKWMNHDVELETGSGIIPVLYSPKVAVNAVQWAIGLELALMINDSWKITLSTDHPNGAPFTTYPEIISLLMSAKARENTIKEKGVNEAVRTRANITSLNRELGWKEIAIMTRAAPAKILGLSNYGKGHLGVGADADVAVYDIKPKEFDPSKDYEKVRSAFTNTAYTIKGGEVVVKDGAIVATPHGRTLNVRVDVGVDPNDEALFTDIKEKFEKYYSVNIGNYPVQDAYLPYPLNINIKPKAV